MGEKKDFRGWFLLNDILPRRICMDRVGSLADLFIASHSENMLSLLHALPIRTTTCNARKILSWPIFVRMGSAARLIIGN